MQRLFKIWLSVILVLAIIATLVIGIESIFFGFLLLPLIIICAFILILGFGVSKK